MLVWKNFSKFQVPMSWLILLKMIDRTPSNVIRISYIAYHQLEPSHMRSIDTFFFSLRPIVCQNSRCLCVLQRLSIIRAYIVIFKAANSFHMTRCYHQVWWPYLLTRLLIWVVSKYSRCGLKSNVPKYTLTSVTKFHMPPKYIFFAC